MGLEEWNVTTHLERWGDRVSEIERLKNEEEEIGAKSIDPVFSYLCLSL